MKSKPRLESCNFSEYSKIFFLHENSLKTKCTQNVLKSIQRQSGPIWERVTILKSNFTIVEQKRERKNFFFFLLSYSISKGKLLLTRMKNIPGFAFNFFAIIVFPLRVSRGNYFKLQWKTFWKGTDDKVN